MSYFKVEQLSYKRRTPKRVNRGKFSPATINHIFERDQWCCGRSNDLEKVPHHIIFKSQNEKGTKDNGVTVCRDCHREAHAKREVRIWFERYQEEVLLLLYKKD